jgi:hypothetical protein|tara:strand:- start:42 stop:584 length:543 start_codon:yes stop_codon:yes gene_type:complete
MKNKKPIKIKNYTDYSNDMYDEMKSLLSKSKLMMEQVEVEDIELERETEKTKTYDVSSGKIVVHGYTTSDVALTDEEKNTYQETMDEFLEQVSDLVDYNTLNIYPNNVEWSGKLVKFDTEFFYSVGERNGVYIIGNMIKIDDEAMEMLNNLKDYYQTFSVKWAKILADRKSTKTMEDENE